jgi:glutaredoxin
MTVKKYMLFFTPMCPKCPKIKEFMNTTSLEKEWVDAATKPGLQKARELGVGGVPMVIFFDENGKEVSRANSLEEVKRVIENKTLV